MNKSKAQRKHLRRRLEQRLRIRPTKDLGKQLALAILADYLGDDQRAVALHQPFKWQVVSGLPHDRWELGRDEIESVVHVPPVGAENRRRR